MSDGIELYLIQSPETAFPADDNTRGYNRDLFKAYRNGIPVSDITNFIHRVLIEVAVKRRRISKLVIGSHGSGIPSGYGHFYIGLNRIDQDDDEKINRLRVLAPLFEKNADVYIMACRTGHATKLLQKVSRALGGVTVHGYTNYITTSNYWLWASIDEGVGDSYTIYPDTSFEEVHVGKHIICWPTECLNISHLPR
jgi:hypothetical protein